MSTDLNAPASQFTIASAFGSSAISVSSYGALSLRVAFKVTFTVRTKCSQNPPKLGAPARMKYHVIMAAYSSTFLEVFKNLFNMVSINKGSPVLRVKRVWSTVSRNISPQSHNRRISRLCTNSRWRALDVRQLKRAAYLFSWRRPIVTVIGRK